MVRIIECRPLSKLKRWSLGDVVRRAVQVGVEPEQVDPAAEAITGARGKAQEVVRFEQHEPGLKRTRD